MLELFTTVATKQQAQRIAATLVKQSLAVCVNFWSVSSIYSWKSKVHRAGEWMLCIKTSEKLGKKAEKKLRELHPYNLSVVVVTKVKVDKKVEKWVNQ